MFLLESTTVVVWRARGTTTMEGAIYLFFAVLVGRGRVFARRPSNDGKKKKRRKKVINTFTYAPAYKFWM